MQSRNRFTRPVATRKPLPIVVIVCDDSRTAVAYFTELKREVKHRVTVMVVEAPCHGATADSVIAVAKARAEELDRERDDADLSAVWALIDLESEPERQDSAGKEIKRASGTDVQIALSKPCFEVWTLAHLVDTVAAFKDCGAVLATVKSEWQKRFGSAFGKQKAQADYSKLMPYRSSAVKRCEQHRQRNDPSWSEVHLVVASIDAICAGDRSGQYPGPSER